MEHGDISTRTPVKAQHNDKPKQHLMGYPGGGGYFTTAREG